MNDDIGYNGWSNWETWTWWVWANNDEGSYQYWIAQADHFTNEKDDAYDVAVRKLAAILEELSLVEMDEMIGQAGIYRDFLNGAFANINWKELAEALIEQAEDIEATA